MACGREVGGNRAIMVVGGVWWSVNNGTGCGGVYGRQSRERSR